MLGAGGDKPAGDGLVLGDQVGDGDGCEGEGLIPLGEGGDIE